MVFFNGFFNIFYEYFSYFYMEVFLRDLKIGRVVNFNVFFVLRVNILFYIELMIVNI